MENVVPIQGETGLADGFRYDIYMKLSDLNGADIFTPPCKDVMAQPFGKVSGGTAFLRTAKQFANIQRLADLFYETATII